MDVRPHIENLVPFGSAVAPGGDERRRLSFVAAFVAAATPLVGYLGNLGLAPLVGLAGLACLPDVRSPRRWPIGAFALLALLAWSLVSYAWSPLQPTLPTLLRKPDSVTGLKLVLEFGLYGAFIAGMARLGPRGAENALLVLATGLGLLLILVAEEIVSGMAIFRAIRSITGDPLREDLPIHRVARCCYVAGVLIWPVGGWLLARGRRLSAGALWLAVLAESVLLHVDSPAIATAVAALVAGAVWLWGRRAALGMAAGAVLYFLFAPVLVHLAAPLAALGKASWAERTQVWRFAVGEIAQRPVIGWGLDASRFWVKDIPLHPHDAAIQIWLELGVVGVGLAAAFGAWLFARLGKASSTHRLAAAAGAGAASAFLSIDALSFGVWQEWWLAVAAIAAGACLWLRAASADQAPAAALAAS